jgi:hypothetical protein
MKPKKLLSNTDINSQSFGFMRNFAAKKNPADVTYHGND